MTDEEKRSWLEEYLQVSHVNTPEDPWRMSWHQRDAHCPPTNLEYASHALRADTGLTLEDIPSDVTTIELKIWERAARERRECRLAFPMTVRELVRRGVPLAAASRMNVDVAEATLVEMRLEESRKEENARRRLYWQQLLGDVTSDRTDTPPMRVTRALAAISPLWTDITASEIWALFITAAARDSARLASTEQVQKLIARGWKPERARAMTRLEAHASLRS